MLLTWTSQITRIGVVVWQNPATSSFMSRSASLSRGPVLYQPITFSFAAIKMLTIGVSRSRSYRFVAGRLFLGTHR